MKRIMLLLSAATLLVAVTASAATTMQKFTAGSIDRSTNELLFEKACGALATKGRVVVVDFAPNEDRLSPRVPALFALMMLGNNAGGDAYTVSEHRKMLRSAGFSDCEVHSLAATPFTAIAAAKL